MVKTQMSWKTRWVLRILPPLIACLGLVLPGCAQVFSLKYSADELNERMKPLFPLQHTQGPFTLKLTEPQVELNDKENRLGIRFNVEAEALGLSSKGSTLIDGTVEYRKSDHSFYIANPMVKDLSMGGVAPVLLSSLRKALNAVSPLLLKDKPVYTLNPAAAKEALAITYLKDVRIVDNHLQIDVSFKP